MVINSFNEYQNRYRRIFKLARSGAMYSDMQSGSLYQRNIEKTLALSLLLALILFRIFPGFHVKNEYDERTQVSRLEVVEIQLTAYNLNPPPPLPIIKETIKTFAVEIKSDVDTLAKSDRDLKLDLNLEQDKNLYAQSQMEDFKYSSSDYAARQYAAASLNIQNDLKLSHPDNINVGFDLEARTSGRKFTEKTIENPTLLEMPSIKDEESAVPERETGLIELNANQFILKESESTIGTTEYRLWNKINSALDRLNKNRYGSLPNNVHRTGGGLNVSFRYGNGIQHDIYWQRGGKVLIRVTGSAPANLTAELENALSALISLTTG